MIDLDPRLRDKRRRLSRMRSIATGLLILMLGLLALALAFRARWPALDWLAAFAEAATVGAVADWFAVVALFRRPLGLPIPHTALIPRNKDRIGAELGRFIEQHFLTPENVAGKLAELDPVGRGARWLSLPVNRRGVAARLGEALPSLLAALDDAEIERLIGGAVTRRLGEIDLGRIAGAVLDFLTEDRRHQVLLDQALALVAGWLDRNRVLILARFSEQSSFTPRFVDGYIVKRFVDGAIDLIGEVAGTPDHELRHRFDRAVRDFVGRLATDPAFRARAEALKHDALRLLAPEQFVATLWRELKRHLAEPVNGAPSPLVNQADRALGHLARSLRDDVELKARVDRAVARLAAGLTGRFRHQVAALISDVVRRWDFREVGERLELEVGRDLQFIRLNGTLVGGLVGLVLHAVLYWTGVGG
ncbi:DUF445 domain-containing protein [Aliidongia dinghuensis]|nr:DUF445 domain-containing protein [Aliidongia dinghuensis]